MGEYLPIGLFVWLLAWSRGSGLPQRDLQHRRLRQQDRFRARVLVCSQEGLRGQGRDFVGLSKLVARESCDFFLRRTSFLDFLELPFCHAINGNHYLSWRSESSD